ncbi:MAG: zf-HC2 domain-containing protein [Actinobacteria bacterium]|nr:zf-HC2 domain-containing protein [Actinomycetota bacterium]
MRQVTSFQARCERARAWVALALDGELSELEGRLLAAHLERCAPCRAVRSELEQITGAIRSAQLELPRRSFELPSRRSSFPARRFSAAAAAMLVAGLGAATVLSWPARGTERSAAPPARAPMVGSVGSDPLLRDLNTKQLPRSIGFIKPALLVRTS